MTNARGVTALKRSNANRSVWKTPTVPTLRRALRSSGPLTDAAGRVQEDREWPSATVYDRARLMCELGVCEL